MNDRYKRIKVSIMLLQCSVNIQGQGYIKDIEVRHNGNATHPMPHSIVQTHSKYLKQARHSLASLQFTCINERIPGFEAMILVKASILGYRMNELERPSFSSLRHGVGVHNRRLIFDHIKPST